MKIEDQVQLKCSDNNNNNNNKYGVNIITLGKRIVILPPEFVFITPHLYILS